MKHFNLPDMGEGLVEAEIVRWHVKPGDEVKADDPMIAMETAKAIVEVPSPYSGVIKATHGNPGDTVATGALLVEFESDEAAADSGTVVGRMPTSDDDFVEHQGSNGAGPLTSKDAAPQTPRVPAVPAVRPRPGSTAFRRRTRPRTSVHQRPRPPTLPPGPRAEQ